MGVNIRQQIKQGILFLALAIYPANQISVPIMIGYLNANYTTSAIRNNLDVGSMDVNKDMISLLSSIRDYAHQNEIEGASCHDFASYVYDKTIEYATLYERNDILSNIRLSSGRVKDNSGWTDHMWIDINMDGAWKMFDPTFNIQAKEGYNPSIEAYPERITLAVTMNGSRRPAPYITIRHFDFMNTGLLAHIMNVSQEGNDSLTNTISEYFR
ncbi:MAG: hypothetical protein ACMXYL_01480 [Candidatus Woesearchaeota archaeon]